MKYGVQNWKPKKIRPNLITISGETGVGTSTLYAGLKRYFGESRVFISASEIMSEYREEFTKEYEVSKEEFAAYNLAHPYDGYHNKCDEEITRRCDEADGNAVVEGRLSYLFALGGFDMREICDPLIRAERRKRQPKYCHLSLEQILCDILQRDRDDIECYNLIRPGWQRDNDYFPQVIDTGVVNEEIMINHSIYEYRKWEREAMHFV